MAKFQCRMPDHDGDESWTEVEAYSARSAAERYSENEDSNSAMERFSDGEECLVIVKDSAGVERKFNVSRESTPSYFATGPDEDVDL